MTLDDFTEQTLEMADDYEGRVIATFMRSNHNKPRRQSVLFIHGYNDYFFHVHLAKEFHERGFNFYAMDLRKHGRSILPHQHQNYCRSISEYFEEINIALEIIKSENKKEVLLLGHSTGGLICSAFMNEGEKRILVQALILNSPFLEFNLPFWQKFVIVPMSGLLSLFSPYTFRKKPFARLYGSSISKQHKGEWDFNVNWKPIGGFPAYLNWVYAVYSAQRKLKRSSDIQVPVLILHSDRSMLFRKWNEHIHEIDIVLNVEHMKKYGRRLGHQVDFLEIKGAIHDVFLSRKEVREKAIEGMFEWIQKMK